MEEFYKKLVEEAHKRLADKTTEYVKSIDGNIKEWSTFFATDILEHETMLINGKAATEEMDTKVEIGEIIKIEGYLSTFKNVDRENDVVLAGAFDDTYKQLKILPLMRNHHYNTQDLMGALKLKKPDEKGLFVIGEHMVTPENIHESMMIKAGFLNSLSMGGAFKYALERNKKGNSQIETVMLWEGSETPIPANAKATFIVKSLDTEENATETDKKEVQPLVSDRILAIKSERRKRRQK